MDDERFCTRCGENVANIPPVQPSSAGGTYQNNTQYANNGTYQNTYGNQQAPGQQSYVYAPPAQQQDSEVMTTGKWVLTIIVTTFFSLISLVFLFIWAFGDGPQNRKNYCKAMLIIKLIEVALSIVLVLFWAGLLSANLPQIARAFEEYSDQFTSVQAAMMSVGAFFGV